ncbi:hypothetical protein FUU19_11855 [Serratia sp. Lou2A]|jgi:hypothetical protein|uniref:Uncharacterized protein n=1 Tax=Serratia montpellierensis TaxID=2598730 RepID=A0ABS8J2A7_9GAMM|nr:MULTISPECIES: hypothetical protein [Serratia]MBH3200735.1 hypothetical protein [Serratia marcescens]MCC7584202.1 hypothetical protein [Serratia sp. Lou2A]MCC7658137.1 hypothetical protein [Serratia sp. Pon4B]CAJ0993643.1 hypothetical protein NVIRSERR_01036 [Serratia marcescens]BEM53023.1 hypothetical protein SME20J_17100 [Serratia marcescens]
MEYVSKFSEHVIKFGVSDIVVTGYIDSDMPPVFHPMYDRVYFISGEAIFEVYIGNDGIVYSHLVENISPWFEVDVDDQFSMMSIYSQAFKTEREVKIIAVNYSEEPFSVFIARYKDGDNENSLYLEPKSFFGFLIS